MTATRVSVEVEIDCEDEQGRKAGWETGTSTGMCVDVEKCGAGGTILFASGEGGISWFPSSSTTDGCCNSLLFISAQN